MRSHTCGDLRADHAGEQVTLAGWVHRCRDQGGLVFLDLRDRYGITQVSVSKDDNADAHAVAQELRPEYTVQVKGAVVARPEGARNDRIATGAIELIASDIKILSESPTPPFPIDGSEEVSDEVRMKHRPLDLRRARVRDNILRRAEMNRRVREYFASRGFVEIETPILAKASPEGSRDYIVPSRIHPGRFYALPQAPQIYKQILMCSGFDRYFQLARCFRDEDLRADRQPEFTQLDLEMSFVEQEDVLGPIEDVISELVAEVAANPTNLPRPWPRIPYAEALAKYGSDKPDLRYGLEIEDVGEVVKRCDFKVFAGALEAGGAVRGIRVPGGAKFSRKEIEAFQSSAATHGAKGLAWMKVTADGASGPISKFFADGGLVTAMKGEEGDLLVFVADADEGVVAWSLGVVRTAVAEALDIVPKDGFAACFIVDFPLFHKGDEGNWEPAHHPFTMPVDEDWELLDTDPGSARARAYDPVLNGVELGSGSIRIHRADLQERIFKAMGMTAEFAQERFGFLLEVLKFGAPPHGGIALGLDRVAMLLSGEDSIREVIAFPKTSRAVDLMSDSPSHVEDQQLDELGLEIRADSAAADEAPGDGSPHAGPVV
ncbi:MAG: aspartate--tRNA ligase [Planctomycetota bacterium]